ncbi:MAG: hypothetical protein JOZ17_13130 [Acetobacteraceae bacterium]|nr:hypothetical protein [Acetobacteraceae bacterium]
MPTPCYSTQEARLGLPARALSFGRSRAYWKAFHQVQSWGLVLLLALGSATELLRVLALVAEALRRVAAVDRRRGRPGTLQTLEQPQGNGPGQGPAGGGEVPQPAPRPRGRPRRVAPGKADPSNAPATARSAA